MTTANLTEIDLNEEEETDKEVSQMEENKIQENDSDTMTSDPHHEHIDDDVPSTTTSQFSQQWTKTIKRIHVPIMWFAKLLTHTASRHPKRMIGFVLALSIGLLLIGLATNFNVDVDEDVLWTPKNSYPIKHMEWIEDESGFPEEPRYFYMFFHADGGNVLGQDQVSRIFEALNMVRNFGNYNEVCADADYTDPFTGETTCEIKGVTRFWKHSTSIYEQEVDSDEDAIEQMSNTTFPDGTPVPRKTIFGYPEPSDKGLLTFAKSYTVVIALPDTDKAEDWELDAVDLILDLDNDWLANSTTNLRVEVQAMGSFGEEFTRAIVTDLPLIPIVFVIMAVFTCAIFARKNAVYSRSLLGFGAVVGVLLSLMTGFGLLFICGVPFTSMTQILPFVIFGIGLDDAFILMGSFGRSDRSKAIVERIDDTIEDVGVSITLTTITSTTAFGIGCASSVPAVYWLCLYAFPTIVMVYLYQLTFFVACMTLDEKRIEERRRDCCVWATAKNFDEERSNPIGEEGHKAHFMDQIMAWYAGYLLKSWVRVSVILAFATLLALCAWSASQFTQEFKFTDVLPDDSYVTDFTEATDDYSDKSGLNPGVYFRWVDQSDKEIQRQMHAFVDDLVAMETVKYEPDNFWLRDFETFVSETEGAADLEFVDQVDLFLSDPVMFGLYNDDIVRDPRGNVIESRCFISMDNIDYEDVNQQIDAYEEQQGVTEAQPINDGKDDFPFFSYDGIYNIWVFYSVSVEELVFTTVIGVACVTGISFLIIPHWSAALFVLPMICILYVDLLGVMQWAGIHINAVSYVSLVMSIGLLVDYIMHVLLRYYESAGNRTEKVVYTLRTMGSSVCLGGVSTFLGTLPLAFSTSDIFGTIFFAFLGLVTLGIGHGLILLPILLSMCGPEDQVTASMRSDGDKDVQRTPSSSIGGNSETTGQ